jgi:hypothetical protein
VVLFVLNKAFVLIIMSVTFSDSLIKEYQAEMRQSYGVLVNADDAQIQLLNLVHGLFPTPEREEWETMSSDSSPRCSRSRLG